MIVFSKGFEIFVIIVLSGLSVLCLVIFISWLTDEVNEQKEEHKEQPWIKNEEQAPNSRYSEKADFYDTL